MRPCIVGDAIGSVRKIFEVLSRLNIAVLDGFVEGIET